MRLSMQFPPLPGQGGDLGTEDTPLRPKFLANLQIPYMQNTVECTEYTKAPPLGRESGLKDTLITTITQEGGMCIDNLL